MLIILRLQLMQGRLVLHAITLGLIVIAVFAWG